VKTRDTIVIDIDINDDKVNPTLKRTKAAVGHVREFVSGAYQRMMWEMQYYSASMLLISAATFAVFKANRWLADMAADAAQFHKAGGLAEARIGSIASKLQDVKAMASVIIANSPSLQRMFDLVEDKLGSLEVLLAKNPEKVERIISALATLAGGIIDMLVWLGELTIAVVEVAQDAEIFGYAFEAIGFIIVQSIYVIGILYKALLDGVQAIVAWASELSSTEVVMLGVVASTVALGVAVNKLPAAFAKLAAINVTIQGFTSLKIAFAMLAGSTIPQLIVSLGLLNFALVSVGGLVAAAFLGWQFGKWLSNLDVFGKSIGNWVEIFMAKVVIWGAKLQLLWAKFMPSFLGGGDVAGAQQNLDHATAVLDDIIGRQDRQRASAQAGAEANDEYAASYDAVAAKAQRANESITGYVSGLLDQTRKRLAEIQKIAKQYLLDGAPVQDVKDYVAAAGAKLALNVAKDNLKALKATLKTAETEYAKHLKLIGKLQSDQAKRSVSLAADIYGLQARQANPGNEEYARYLDTMNRINTQAAFADSLSGEEKIKALEQYASMVKSAAHAWEDTEGVILSEQDALGWAIAQLQSVQGEIDTTHAQLLADAQKRAESTQTWIESLRVDVMDTERQVQALSDWIATIANQEANIPINVIDNASGVLNHIRSLIDEVNRSSAEISVGAGSKSPEHFSGSLPSIGGSRVSTGDIIIQESSDPEGTQRAVEKAFSEADWRQVTRVNVAPELERMGRRNVNS
jgi:hypothetical protein